MAGDDLVVLLEAAEDFDVGGAGDAGRYGDEANAEAVVVLGDEIDALDEVGLLARSRRSGGGGRLAVILEESGFLCRIAHDQRLNGDGEGVRLVRGGDLGGAGEAGTEIDLGGVEGDDDLEVLGLFGAGGGLRGGDAGGAQQGLIADFGDLAGEGLAGEGVNGDARGLAEGNIDDVGLIDLDFGGDDGHVGEGHQGRSLGVLDADDDGLALADGDVGDQAIEGSDAAGEAERIGVSLQRGGILLYLAAGGGGLSLGLGDGSLALGEGRDVDIVGSLLGVEVLLGDEVVLVEGLGALVVEFLLLEVSLGLFDVGFRGLLGGDVGIDVGA